MNGKLRPSMNVNRLHQDSGKELPATAMLLQDNPYQDVQGTTNNNPTNNRKGTTIQQQAHHDLDLESPEARINQGELMRQSAQNLPSLRSINVVEARRDS